MNDHINNIPQILEELDELKKSVKERIWKSDWDKKIKLFEEHKFAYLFNKNTNMYNINMQTLKEFLIDNEELKKIKTQLEYTYKQWDNIASEIELDEWNNNVKKDNVTEKRKKAELKTIHIKKVREAIKYFYNRIEDMEESCNNYIFALHKEIKTTGQDLSFIQAI